MVLLNSILITLVCSFAVSAFPSWKRTVAHAHVVEVDISDITTRTNALHASIDGFPTGGTIFHALAIHNAVTSLDAAIKTGTSNAQIIGPLNMVDGTSALHRLEALGPVITSALEMIAVKKPAFDSLHFVSAIAKRNLSTLNKSTNAFEAAMLAVTPAEIIDDAMALKSTLDEAFQRATVAYADA